MTGGGGGVIIIRALLDSGRLTAKEQTDVCAIRDRSNGGLCNKKDAKRLGAICERIASTVM